MQKQHHIKNLIHKAFCFWAPISEQGWLLHVIFNISATRLGKATSEGINKTTSKPPQPWKTKILPFHRFTLNWHMYSAKWNPGLLHILASLKTGTQCRVSPHQQKPMCQALLSYSSLPGHLSSHPYCNPRASFPPQSPCIPLFRNKFLTVTPVSLI